MAKQHFLIFSLSLFFILSSNVYSMSVQWETGANDILETIGGFDILEYNDATLGGGDWDVTGSGLASGISSMVASELWLISTPNTASTTFSVASTAVGFMMRGDGNDGFAEFFVDDVIVGTFDMLGLGNQTLIISDLDLAIHTISVVQTGLKNPSSSANHVAIYGGAALATPVPMPSGLILFVSAIMSVMRLRK